MNSGCGPACLELAAAQHLCQLKCSCVVPPSAAGHEKSVSQEGSNIALARVVLVLQRSEYHHWERLKATTKSELCWMKQLWQFAEQHTANSAICSHTPPPVGQTGPFKSGVPGPLPCC